MTQHIQENPGKINGWLFIRNNEGQIVGWHIQSAKSKSSQPRIFYSTKLFQKWRQSRRSQINENREFTRGSDLKTIKKNSSAES